jgi:hypothetical protein
LSSSWTCCSRTWQKHGQQQQQQLGAGLAASSSPKRQQQQQQDPQGLYQCKQMVLLLQQGQGL